MVYHSVSRVVHSLIVDFVYLHLTIGLEDLASFYQLLMYVFEARFRVHTFTFLIKRRSLNKKRYMGIIFFYDFSNLANWGRISLLIVGFALYLQPKFFVVWILNP